MFRAKSGGVGVVVCRQIGRSKKREDVIFTFVLLFISHVAPIVSAPRWTSVGSGYVASENVTGVSVHKNGRNLNWRVNFFRLPQGRKEEVAETDR